MSLKVLRAHFECDRCGAPFTVELDSAYKPPENWTIFDVAEDAIRGTFGPEVQEGRHICTDCVDKEIDDEDDLPEVESAPDWSYRPEEHKK